MASKTASDRTVVFDSFGERTLVGTPAKDIHRMLKNSL